MSGGGGVSGGGFRMPGNTAYRGRDSDTMSSDDGLNPNRQKGFGATASRRIETPTLNDMRARQGAVVGKFMNFMQRKNTAVIDLYDRPFFAKRPTWDSLLNSSRRMAVIGWWGDFRYQMGYCGRITGLRSGDIVWMLR